MHFLVDAQLPPALAHALVQAGHRAEHVSDIGMQAAPDAAIWTRAAERGATIVTKDEDFAQRRMMAAEGPRGVDYVTFAVAVRAAVFETSSSPLV